MSIARKASDLRSFFVYLRCESYGLETPDDLESSDDISQANEGADEDWLIEEDSRSVLRFEMREGRHQTPIHFMSILMGYPTTFRLTDFPSYVFCLVCHFEWVTSRKGESRSSKLFEELSCLAAARYFGGQAVNFGAPRTQAIILLAAIDQLCVLIEGDGHRAQTSNPRMTSWMYPGRIDKLPGKLLVGQCAAGKMAYKLTEIQATSSPNCDPERYLQQSHQIIILLPHRWRGGVICRHHGGVFLTDAACALGAWCEKRRLLPYLDWVKGRFSSHQVLIDRSALLLFRYPGGNLACRCESSLG